jgi:hypothetical protein
MQDFLEVEQIRRSVKLSITNIGDRELLTIANGDLLGIGVGGTVWKVINIRMK